MLITRTRTAIIALVASASFAVASAAPAVSHAQFLHYCVAGHCTTAPNALTKSSVLGGAGNSPCEANKVAFEASKVPIDPGLPTNGPVVDTNDGLGDTNDGVGGQPIAESPEQKEQAARQKEHEKDEEEARAAEAERAAFESGCSTAGLHTK
jgi:hypothetical protein